MKTREVRFGRNLKALREIHDVKQQQLADELHMARQTISMWEKGNGRASIYDLDAICSYFDVSIDQMMYGKIVSPDHYQTLEDSDIKEQTTGEEELVDLLEEDIYECFPPIVIDFGILMTIALELKRIGYEVIEVFGNGFSVFTKTKMERERLKRDIYEVGDSLIHCDNERISNHRDEVEARVWEVKSQIVEETMTIILGKEPEEFAYLWYDEEDNVRGYADTEEECIEQARHQACTKFRIMDNI